MNTVLTVVVIYLVILIGLRIVGKREFGQLSPLELITLMTIPEMVSQALNGEDYSITHAVIGVATLLALTFITSLLSYRSHLVEKLVSGGPCLLMEQGKFIAVNMDRERISAEEILAEMHKVGIERIAQVKWAILEADGKISIIPTAPIPSPSPSMVNPPASQELV